MTQEVLQFISGVYVCGAVIILGFLDRPDTKLKAWHMLVITAVWPLWFPILFCYAALRAMIEHYRMN